MKRLPCALLTTLFAFVLTLIGTFDIARAAPEPRSFAIQKARDDFSPNILDASAWVEAPTGKHGLLTRKGEQFVFEDGTPGRFWGGQMNPLSKQEVDYTVKRMRRQGINITRMHGLEFLNKHDAKTIFDYDDAAWDRLDYLIAKLGENGIYIILDTDYPLILQFKPGDNIPELPHGGSASYAEFFNEKVAVMLQRRIRDVFTHRNRYNGKRYADDPTIALVEIQNEDSLFWGIVEGAFRKELEQKFVEWLRAKYKDNDGLKAAWTAAGKSPVAPGQGIAAGQIVPLLKNWDFNQGYLSEHPEAVVQGRDQLTFYEELEEAYWRRSVETLRKAGVRVPVTGTNWQGHEFLTRVHLLGQSKLDYLDRHGYWDHPQGEGNLKWNIRTASFHNRAMVKALDAELDRIFYGGSNKFYGGSGNLVTEKAWERILGMPMTISEWNTCLPNEFSLEGTGLMAAYGQLQGWNALLEFGYFSPDFLDKLGEGSFDMFGNPPQILQFPAVATMFHRHDVTEANLVAESYYDADSLYAWNEDRKPLPLWSALVGKVGYRFGEKPRNAPVKDLSRYWDAKSLTARSMTGELTWNASVGLVTIDTARTQAAIGFLSAEPYKLGAATLNVSNRFGALYVTAMDGLAPIVDAKRLLITAVGPARNSGMEYEPEKSSDGLWHLKQEGHGPALMEAITGELRLRVKNPQQFKCWALNVVGKRVREVRVRVENGELVLNMGVENETAYYELAVQ